MVKSESGRSSAPTACPSCGYTPTAYQHVTGCAYTPTAGLPEARPEPTSDLVARLFARQEAQLAAARERHETTPERPPVTKPPEARKGGRPTKGGVAMTAAERQRARRERERQERGAGRVAGQS